MSFNVSKPSFIISLTNCLELARDSASKHNTKEVSEKVQEFANIMLASINDCKLTDPNLTHLIIEMMHTSGSFASDSTNQALANTIVSIVELTPKEEIVTDFNAFVKIMKESPNAQINQIITSIENTDDIQAKLNLLKKFLLHNPEALLFFLHPNDSPKKGDVSLNNDLVNFYQVTPKVKIKEPFSPPPPPPSDKITVGLGVAGSVLPIPQKVVKFVQKVPQQIEPENVINALVSDQSRQYVKFVSDIPKEVFLSVGIMGNTLELAFVLRKTLEDNPELKIKLDDFNKKIESYEISNQKNDDYEKLIKERNHLVAEEIRRQSKAPLVSITTATAETYLPLLGPVRIASEFWVAWNKVKSVKEKISLLQGTIHNLDHAIHELKALAKSNIEPVKSIYKMKINSLEVKKANVLKTGEELKRQGLIPAIKTGLAMVSLGLIATGVAMHSLSAESTRSDFGINQYKGGTVGALVGVVSLFPIAQGLWQLGTRAGNKIQDTAFGKIEDSKQKAVRLNEEELAYLKEEKRTLLQTKYLFQEELDGHDTIYSSPVQSGSKRWDEIQQKIGAIDKDVQSIETKIEDHLFAKEIGMTLIEFEEKFKNIENAKSEKLNEFVQILSNLEIIKTDEEKNSFLINPKVRMAFIKKFIFE